MVKEVDKPNVFLLGDSQRRSLCHKVFACLPNKCLVSSAIKPNSPLVFVRNGTNFIVTNFTKKKKKHYNLLNNYDFRR